MRKLSICLILCFFLTGCGLKEDAPVEEETEKVVLEYFTWQDEKDYAIRVVNHFMEENPGIIVNMHFVPSSEYAQTISVIHNTRDSKIDVFAETKPSNSAADVERSFVLDITDMYQRVPDMPEDYAELLDALKINGRVYMLPYRKSTWAVYYNKNLFDQFGIPYPEGSWTWEDYTELAKELTRTIDGQKIYGSLSYETSSLWWRTPARTAGVENQVTESGLEWLKKSALWNYRMSYEFQVQPAYTELTDVSSYDYINRFLAGNIGMFYCGDWCMEIIRRQLQEKQLDFSYDVAPIPMPAQAEGFMPVTTAVVQISSRTEHPEEALRLAEYISGEEGAAIIAGCSVFPAWDTEEIREILKNSEHSPKHIEYFWDYNNPIYTSPDKEMEEALEIINTYVGRYFLKEISLEDAFSSIRSMLLERGLLSEDEK